MQLSRELSHQRSGVGAGRHGGTCGENPLLRALHAFLLDRPAENAAKDEEDDAPEFGKPAPKPAAAPNVAARAPSQTTRAWSGRRPAQGL